MAKLWDRLQQLFRQEASRPAQQPFLQSAIESPLVDTDQVEQWIRSPARSKLMTSLVLGYQQRITGMPPIGNSIQYVSGNGIDAFVVYCQDYDQIAHSDFLALLEEHKESLQQINYIKNLGDIRSYEKSNNLYKTYRYYLKPSIRLLRNGKSEQLYGNVTLEYVVLNGEPHHYKLSANTYNDHKYHDALDHMELVKLLSKSR